MRKVIYASIMAMSMVGVADKASASIHDYPPPQYVVDKLTQKTQKPAYRFLDVDHIQWYCTTRNRVNYRCYLSATDYGDLIVNRARFKLTIKKGYRHTRVYEDMSGTIHLNRTRYGVLSPLDW